MTKENEIIGRIKIGQPGSYEWSLVRRREGVLWYWVGATAHNPDGYATLAPDLFDRVEPVPTNPAQYDLHWRQIYGLPPTDYYYNADGKKIREPGATNGQ